MEMTRKKILKMTPKKILKTSLHQIQVSELVFQFVAGAEEQSFNSWAIIDINLLVSRFSDESSDSETDDSASDSGMCSELSLL
jgi:hypothetical protein